MVSSCAYRHETFKIKPDELFKIQNNFLRIKNFLKLQEGLIVLLPLIKMALSYPLPKTQVDTTLWIK